MAQIRSESNHLLAHVLANFLQKMAAAISMMPQADADLEIDPDPQLEREADRAPQEAQEGDEALVVKWMGTGVHVQRSEKEDAIFSSTQLRSLIGDELNGPLSSQELVTIVDAVEQRIEGTETNGSRFEGTNQ